MEYWDLYDYKGKKKDKIAIRGTKLNNNDFHLVINAWILNDNGEFLITQRSKNKSHPLMWECTGGSALIGETSLDAAIREIKEELGIDIDSKTATFIGESRRFYESCPDILHVWLFKSNEDIKNIKIQEEEVNDVMWASKEKILELFKDNKFEANSFFNKVICGNNINYTSSLNNKLDIENDIIKLLGDKIPMINREFINKEYDYDTIKKIVNSRKMIIGNEYSFFYVDNKNKFNKYASLYNNKYYLFKYIECLPISVIVIIGKNNDVILPISINLIKIENNKLKYVGEDFIYSQKFNDKINRQIEKYTDTIIKELKEKEYKGIIKINYIIDNKDNIYFTKLSNNYQSSFIINKYLNKYCLTSLEELNYLAITNNCVGNTYLDKIDNSFIIDINNYPEFKYYKIFKRKYKLFNYSIIKQGDFLKRKIDK